MTENKIPLSITETQILFHNYEMFSNGCFFYEELLKDLKSLYHSQEREKFILNFYQKLCNTLGRNIKLTDIKRILNPRRHPLYNQGVSEDELCLEFYDLVDCFQFTSKLARNDSILTKENFVEFFKYFGFGIDQDENFIFLVNNILDISKWFNQDAEFSISTPNGNDKSKNLYSNENPVRKPSASKFPEEEEIFSKLRQNLKTFGRKSLFYLIKHFKYYDANTKFINKYDFAKVMKDFRINLQVSEIEKVFEWFCADKKSQLINYEDFFKQLTYMNATRSNLVQSIYYDLKRLNAEVDLDLLKNVFNSKNHPLIKDGGAFSEFFECLELFHYAYLGKKKKIISEQEFIEFYQIISFLIEEEEMFHKILISEWKNVTGLKSNLKENSNQPSLPKNTTNDYNIYSNQYLKTDERAPSSYSHNSNSQLDKIKLSENKNIPTDIPKFPKAIQPPRSLTPNQANEDTSQKSSIRPATPLTKNLTQNEKEVALAQNQYLKTRTPVNDAIEKLKKTLRKRGIRGLMNLHKQFLLNCMNPNTISYGDFVKVLKLQRIELKKEDYDEIFERFRNSSKNIIYDGTFLNFSAFIRNFKKVLPDSRLNWVEKVFSNLDYERSEMLFIEDIKLKYDASNHPEVLKKIRTEDEVIVEFLDCFELNYNFLVSYKLIF